MILFSSLYAPMSANSDTSRFRIGFSSSTFTDLNENDAMAAVRIWSQALAKEKNIPADPQPGIFYSLAEIRNALTTRQVDCINLSTVEYFQLRPLLTSNEIITAVTNNAITEEYVVIVNKASKIEKMSQLEGKSLSVLENARTSLSRIWLDTELARDGHSDYGHFFGKVATFHNAGKAVLPVFFKQFDATIVTRNSFAVMVELNPQIGQQLRILATSPPFVPALFCFRAGYNSPLKTRLLQEIANWHLSPSGRQILTIFQTESLAEHPVSCLDDTLALLVEHQNLFHLDYTVKGV